MNSNDSLVCPLCDYKDSQAQPLIIKRDLALAAVAETIRPRHCTVWPRAHRARISELTAAESAEVMQLIADVSRALEQEPDVIKVYLMSISDAVEHVHFHLIPKLKGRPPVGEYWVDGIVASEGEVVSSDGAKAKLSRDLYARIQG